MSNPAGPMAAIMTYAMDQGLYLSFCFNVIGLTPPLNVTEEVLDFTVDVLDRMLNIADRLKQ